MVSGRRLASYPLTPAGKLFAPSENLEITLKVIITLVDDCASIDNHFEQTAD